MRKALIGILLAASAALPAAAIAAPKDDQDRPSRSEARAERQAQRNETRAARPAPQAAPQQQQQQRGNWAGRSGGTQAPAGVQQPQATAQNWRGNRGGSGSRDAALQQRIQESRAASQASAVGLSPHYQQKAAENQARYEQQLREQYRDRRGDRNDWRDNRGNDRNDWQNNRNNDRGNWNGQRNGRNDWRGNRNGSRVDWNRGWRQDNRYDWQRYRSSNRNIFHQRPYYAPYRGYNYSRFSIGLFLDQGFYARNYWLSDPWMYRLPPAPPGTQWVRYYNDVLLVDIYSGQVVDAIYDFFW